MNTVKCYKFRLYPTKAQEALFLSFAGCRRFVWNWALARKQAVYKETGKSISSNDLCRELTILKKQPETAFLAEAPNASLQQALRDLDAAYSAFFAKRTRYPRFKSRKRTPHAFRFPEYAKVLQNAVQLPKIGRVKAVIHRQPEGVLKSATVKQEAGAWYVVFVAHVELPDVPATCSNPVGLDVGLESFVTLSDGEKVTPPKFYRKAEKKMARLQRQVSRCQKQSNRRQKAKARLARFHARVTNQRKDFLHNLSARIVREFDTLCIEDLNLNGLVKTKLAKSFSDAALGEFLQQLQYKAQWRGGQVVKVGRFYPSSKTCYTCGSKQALILSQRRWTCEGCGGQHDRDTNAAQNILREGLRTVAVMTTDTQNAHGAEVRPATVGTRRRSEKLCKK